MRAPPVNLHRRYCTTQEEVKLSAENRNTWRAVTNLIERLHSGDEMIMYYYYLY